MKTILINMSINVALKIFLTLTTFLQRPFFSVENGENKLLHPDGEAGHRKIFPTQTTLATPCTKSRVCYLVPYMAYICKEVHLGPRTWLKLKLATCLLWEMVNTTN